MHRSFTGSVYLDLYVRNPDKIGAPAVFDKTFTPVAAAGGWELPAAGSVITDAAGARILNLTKNQAGEMHAELSMPINPANLYVLSFDARSTLQSGGIRAFLLCLSKKGELLLPAPHGGGAAPPNDGQWHRMYIAALCPPHSTRVSVDLRNAGIGETLFRDVNLVELKTTPWQP
jgi:hypothetical protein